MSGRAVVEKYDGTAITLLYVFGLDIPVVGVVPTPSTDLPATMQVAGSPFTQGQLNALDSGDAVFVRKSVGFNKRVRAAKTRAQILTYITDVVLASVAMEYNAQFNDIDRSVVGFVINVA